MKKLYLILMLVMFISFTSAVSIGTYKQNENIELYQTCNNCTYCNLTVVKYPNSTNILTNVEMNKDGTYYDYNLLANNLSVLGTYKYCYDCGNDVETETGCINFDITPSGNSGSSNIVFFVFVIILIYGITFVSFFYGRNIPLTVLGGMAMIFLGVYIINNGIIIFRDTLTNYIAYITIGIGFMLGMWAILEELELI